MEMEPGRMPWNMFQTYAKQSGIYKHSSNKEVSALWKAAQVAAGITPSKTAKVKATKRDEVKNNEALAGEAAAISWGGLNDEDKADIEEFVNNEPDTEFSVSFRAKAKSLREKELESKGAEETKGDEDDAGGEEAREEKSDLKREAPLDDEERKQALKELLGKHVPKETLVDDMGLPLGKEALLTLAQLTPIWGTLTDRQKGLFLEEQGTFASGRQYVTSARKLRKPKNIRRKLQTSSGQVIFI
jgi:hypothetical protein